MKARLIKFGEIEVEGTRYSHDVVIDGGKVRKRKKGPSKQFREEWYHVASLLSLCRRPNTRLIALVIDSDHQAAIEGRGVLDHVFADNSLTKNTVNSAEKCVI